MAREMYRLSAGAVATITKHGRHSDGGGLYLSISPNGGRRWTFLYRWRGKPTELGFTILCAARTGEVLGARWDEIDLDRGVWTIPAPRMKGEREHRVPLPDRAVAI